jgi:hypothetical protein
MSYTADDTRAAQRHPCVRAARDAWCEFCRRHGPDRLNDAAALSLVTAAAVVLQHAGAEATLGAAAGAAAGALLARRRTS